MKKLLGAITLLFFNVLVGFTQPPPDADVVKDIEKNDALTIGTKLFELEQACRNGIQILGSEHQDIKIHGFTAYEAGDSIKALFWREETNWQLVVAVFTFPKPIALDNYTVDTESRLPNDDELALIRVKKEASKALSKPGFFKNYQNCFLHPIILTYEDRYEAYVITVPNISTSLLFDNDYRIVYDLKANEVEREEINTNMQAVPSIIQLQRKKANYTEHKHPKSGPHGLTATDLCILMLYEPYVNWEEHRLESETGVSIFQLEDKVLLNQQKK